MHLDFLALKELLGFAKAGASCQGCSYWLVADEQTPAWVASTKHTLSRIMLVHWSLSKEYDL